MTKNRETEKEEQRRDKNCSPDTPEMSMNGRFVDIRDVSTFTVDTETVNRNNMTVGETGTEDWRAGSGQLDDKTEKEVKARNIGDGSKPPGSVEDGQQVQHPCKTSSSSGAETKLLLRTQMLGTVLMSLVMMSHATNSFFSGFTLPQLTDPENEDFFLETWQAGLFASLSSLGTLIGSIASGPMMVWLGHRVAVLVMIPGAGVFWLLLSFAHTVWLLLICRFFLGVLGGVFYACASTYVLEITHKSIRGTMCGLVVLSFNAGALLNGVLGLSGLYWRNVGFVACILFVTSFVGLLFLPSSPRWLVSRGRLNDSKNSIIYFRGKDYDYDSELLDIVDQVDSSMAMGNSSWQQIKQLLKPSTLKRFCQVTFLLFFHRLSGYYTVLSYIVPIFKAAGSSIDPYISSVISSMLTVLGSSLQMYLVDRYGRKPLMVTSLSGCTICTAALGSYFYMFSNNVISNIDWFPLTSIGIYLFLSSISYAVLTILPGELLPTSCRSVGISLCYVFVIVGTFSSATAFLYMVEALGQHGTFWFFSGCSAVLVFVSARGLPETKGRSLEEINLQPKQQEPERSVQQHRGQSNR